MTRVVVAGTGALACVFAAALERAGAEVLVFGRWREQLDAIGGRGIAIGDEPRVRVRATGDAGELAVADLVLVLCKSYDVDRRLGEVRGAIGPDTAVVALQNGLRAWKVLARTREGIPVAGETRVAATLVGPAAVRLHNRGASRLGPVLPGGEAACERAAAILRAAGLPAEVTGRDDLRRVLWEKLMLAAGLNPLSIALRVPVSGVLASDGAVRILRAAMAEVAAVAAAEGIALDVERACAAAAGFGDNLPSGLQDFLNGRPSEVPDINGAVISAGRDAGVATPVNAVLADLVAGLYESAPHRVVSP